MGEKNPSGEHCLRKFHSEQIPVPAHRYQWRFPLQSTFARRYFCGFCTRASCIWGRKYFVEIEERRVGSAYRLHDDCDLRIYIYFQQAFVLAKTTFRDIYTFIKIFSLYIFFSETITKYQNC